MSTLTAKQMHAQAARPDIYEQIFRNPADLQFSLHRNGLTGQFGLLITRGADGQYERIHLLPSEYSRENIDDIVRQILMVALAELPQAASVDLDAIDPKEPLDGDPDVPSKVLNPARAAYILRKFKAEGRCSTF